MGDTIAYVDYDDASPWPTEADGNGPSMVFCDKSSDNNDGTNWSLSLKFVTMINGDSLFGYPGHDCFIDAVNSATMKNLSISVYPNPASQVINIVTDGNSCELRIMDVSGALIEVMTLSGTNNKIRLDNYSGGLYFMEFTDKKTSRQKVVKLIVQ